MVATAGERTDTGDDRAFLDLAVLTHADFAARLNEEFTISPGELSIQAQLVGVVPWRASAAQRRQPFTLTFQGPNQPVLSQRIHVLENPSLGKMEVFLVPIGPNQFGMEYEVVFS
jgi:hypothetical protein